MLIQAVEEEKDYSEQYLPGRENEGKLDLSHLPEGRRGELLNILPDDLFTEWPGRTALVEHRVVLKEGQPIRQPCYRVPERLLPVLKEELEVMQEMGVIEPSYNEWSSPVILVPKKDGSLSVDHGGENRTKPGPRKYGCRLTLDPNTAHRHLSLSEGNRSVTHTPGREEPYPDHPERFECVRQVFCRESVYGCRLTLDPNTAHRELSLSEGNRSVTHTPGRREPYPDHPGRFGSLLQVLCRESVCQTQIVADVFHLGYSIVNQSAIKELDTVFKEDQANAARCEEASEEPVDLASLLIKFAELCEQVNKSEKLTKDLKSENIGLRVWLKALEALYDSPEEEAQNSAVGFQVGSWR
ncbi:hypothetical protein GJAV_G00215140 [Gymnothorax javanicus]|nr:hypothetical protein GJAV_G00215140 [Gymnothorax javanicus]